MESDHTAFIHRYTLRQLLNYVRTVPIDEIAFIKQAYHLNLILFQEALKSNKATISRNIPENSRPFVDALSQPVQVWLVD